MTTPLDIITDAMLSIGAVAGGETPTPDQSNDGLRFLNRLMDQLSNEPQMLFCKQEVIHELTAGQYIYTIGAGGQVGANFTGAISGSTLTVSAIASGALSVGQTVQGTSAGSGSVTSLDSLVTGVGYTTQPTLTFAGDGAGAAGTCYLQYAIFAGSPILISGGTGFKAGQLLTASGGTFLQAMTFRVAAVAAGVITVLVSENIGLYTAVINGSVNLSGGTGTGCRIDMTNAWGAGGGVVTNPGFGYTFCTVTIVGGGGAGAAMAAVLGGNVADGTAITSYGTGLGGNVVSALGTYKLNLSQTSVPAMAMVSYAPRPLKINSAFVRIPSSSGNLDYVVDPINVEQYERIGLKQLNGPWPRMVYYQPSQPLGVLNYWPNPSQGEMHLICDMLFNHFTSLSDSIILPQGFEMALMWMLAEILMPQYPATAAAQETRAMVPAFASQGRALIKRTNMQPVQQVQFDSILNSARTQDAGWILSGGFNRG